MTHTTGNLELSLEDSLELAKKVKTWDVLPSLVYEHTVLTFPNITDRIEGTYEDLTLLMNRVAFENTGNNNRDYVQIVVYSHMIELGNYKRTDGNLADFFQSIYGDKSCCRTTKQGLVEYARSLI